MSLVLIYWNPLWTNHNNNPWYTTALAMQSLRKTNKRKPYCNEHKKYSEIGCIRVFICIKLFINSYKKYNVWKKGGLLGLVPQKLEIQVTSTRYISAY